MAPRVSSPGSAAIIPKTSPSCPEASTTWASSAAVASSSDALRAASAAARSRRPLAVWAASADP
eukprot:CAMPEP_0172582602 /NCGR_PEP_ID=MMETSP1068-20121228/2090_1 /TAXON_ID=35684 /ORGANISM="Pseudopedinella elastica, Strain CCMP716" /LENGTH=63 /DNA_ID=CAMNT_0013376049 /DNA_START=151 /DNA_END=339 /DNA_ORIENTATION=+